MIKTFLKDKTGQIILFLIQIYSKYLKRKEIRGFVRGLFSVLKGQYGSNQIFPDSSFSKDAWNRNKIWAFDGNL